MGKSNKGSSMANQGDRKQTRKNPNSGASTKYGFKVWKSKGRKNGEPPVWLA